MLIEQVFTDWTIQYYLKSKYLSAHHCLIKTVENCQEKYSYGR